MNKRWLILCKSALRLFIAGISLGMTDVLADDICKMAQWSLMNIVIFYPLWL